jgi:hypothetical protein
MNAKLIKTTGETIEVTPENGTDFKLAQLYALLDCETIEVIYLKHDTSDDDLIMIGDEEGRLVDDPELNAEATKIYRESWNVGAPYDIVGNVILCKSKMLK